MNENIVAIEDTVTIEAKYGTPEAQILIEAAIEGSEIILSRSHGTQKCIVSYYTMNTADGTVIATCSQVENSPTDNIIEV